MTMFLVTPPAVEPVTIAEVRAFLRLSDSSEDDILRRLIATARELIEKETGLALIDQTWRLHVDRWPRSGRLALFRFPVKSITSVAAYRADGTAIFFQPEEYALQSGRRPQRVYLAQYPDAQSFTGIEVDFVAGFGETGVDVPDMLKHALLVFVGHLYENRSGLVSETVMPPLVQKLTESWKQVLI